MDHLEEFNNYCLQVVQTLTTGRDESHGYKHMQEVSIMANHIYTILCNHNCDYSQNKNIELTPYGQKYKLEKCKPLLDNFYEQFDECKQNIHKLVLLVAWFHDVNDHKYSTSTSREQMLDALEDIINKFSIDVTVDKVVDIIERISFSKEMKGIDDWLTLLDEDGMIIRDIVSDADKLYALGKIGYKRCYDYGYEKMGYREPELCGHIIRHSDEKLFKLADCYIRTWPAQEIALKEHDIFVEEMKNKLNYSP